MKPYSGEEFDPKQPVKAKTPKPYDGAEYTPSDPNNRTWGEFATDTALTIGQSAADLLGAVGQAANVVTGGMVDEKFVKPLEKPARALLGGDPTPKGIAGITSDIDQAAQGAKSAKLQREQQELAQTRGFLDSAAKVLGSPALAFDMAAQQVPIVAGMAVGARGASKKAQTKALKDVPEPTAAQRLGAQEAGKKAAERAIVGQSAVMGGGYSANQSIQQAMALPDHVWAANPEFQALVQAGMDPQQAKEKIANRAALEPLAIGAGVNALAARLTAPLEARIFTGSVEPGGVAGLMTKEGLTKVAQTAGKEAIEEGVTEAGEQLGSNLGVQQIDPSQDPLAGVPEAAGAATVLGAGFGGGMQVVGTAISPSQGKTVVNPADGPLSKAVASTVAGTSEPAALQPVVVDDTPTRTAKQAEQAQQAEDQKAELQDAPAQNARTFKQAQSIATGQPAPVEPQPASPEEIRAELEKRADTIIDANTMKALAKRFNVPVNVISQQRRAMRQAELFGTPAEGSSATQKEVIREGVQGLPAGQQEGRQDAVQEIRQPEAAQAGGDQGGGETAQPRSADAGSPAGVRGQEDGDVTPDGDLRVALKKATQATGADGAEYTVRAFSSGEGFFFMRKTDGKATRHQSQNNAQPWSYEQAADEAAKLAGQNKDKNDVPLREKSRTSAAGDVQAPKKSPRRNAGDSNAKVAAAPVAKGADAPPAVRTEQGEAVGGGEKAQTNELRQPVAEAKGTVGEVASGRSEDAPPEPLTIRYGKRGAAPLKGTKAKPSSWIIRDKATGKAVMETTDQKKVDALNTKKYEAVPASQHLAELNDKDTKARKAAEGQDLTTIFRDAYLKAYGNERALPDKNYTEAAEQISKLIEAKSADGLFSRGLTDAKSNPAARAVFEAATGIKLPKGVKASREAIDAWAGVTPEERAKRTQDRKEALDKESAERQLPYTRRRAAAVKVNDDSGATTNGADYIDKLIADGYDKIVKRGTVTYLANSDGRGFRISNKNLTAYAREAVKAKQGKPERRNMAERARIDALPADERDAEIARLRADNEALRKAADTDSRTGLKNPGAYDRDVKSAKGVAAIDLTLFKGYNTLLTDAGGDAVLSVFGQAMKEVGGDQAYRRGGDEFAFLTDSPEKAQELLAQLQQRAGDIELITQGANGSLYTVSGVPFAGGVGSNEKEAIQARDEGKPKGDRNALPANVRPKDAGRSEEVGPEGKDRGGKTKAKVKTRAPTDAEKAEGIVAVRGDDKAKGERKFYVTMLRDSKVARLAGPFDTKPEAEAMVEPARKAAEEADSRAAFDSFGVSGITSENHRPGVLNLKLGLPSNREIITPADDKILGKNAYDEPVYERKDGSRYVMKDGRPNFGGALVTVNEESEDQIERGLAEYGYTLKDGEIISPAGKPSGVTITVKNGRARIGTDSNKLWTGDPANIGNFLEKFWFAKKVEKDDVAFSRPDRSITDETRTENFKRWSNNAPMVTSAAAMTHEFKSGKKVVVEAFHGTQRPDRVGKYFSAKRATSGPMQYFTSDPAIASNYAKGKNDTSLFYEDVGYESWFKVKVKGARNPVNLDRAWYSFAPEVRQNIAALAPRVHLDDAGEKIILGDEGETRGIGSYDYEIKQARGNVLKALIESWLNSGALFGDETRFMDVLKTAGVPVENIVFDSPHAEFPAVIPAYIAMQNPLVTNDIPTKVDDALQAAAKRSRERGQKYGADMWDKNTRTLREWVNNYNQPDREYVWTIIPDSVTAVFKSLGYDGIVDVGGKAGGDKHKVYVPFNEDQVKGRFNKGTFDPLKKDNLLSRPDPAGLATGNRGTFDPNNPSIVASRMEPGRPTDPTEFIMGVQSLTNGLQTQVLSWKGDAPKVRFVQSAKELPKAVQRSQGWEDVEGFYDDKTGTVWLVADNLPNLSRARQVLAHEAFGHYGVEGVVGKDEWARIVSDVAKLKGSSSLSPEMKQALASTIRRYPNANPVLFAREFIAVMAERGVKSSLIGRILAKVRAWARKLGFNIDAWNEQEMRELVARGVRSVEKGGSIANNSRGAKGYALSDTSGPFYSALYESLALAQGAPKKGNASAWKGWLDGAQRRGEFRQAERDWLGLDDWLKQQDGAVTREALADFVRANQVQVQDVVLSDADKQAASRARDLYRQRQAQEGKVNSLRSRATDDMYSRSIRDEAAALLPDAEKELMRLDVAYETANRAAKQAIEQDTPTKFASYQLPGGDNYRELLLTLANKDGKPNGRGLNDEEIEDLNQRFEAAGYAGGMDDEQIDLAKHGGMDAIDMLDDMEGRMGVKTSDLRAVLAGEKNADDLLRRQQSEFRSTHFDQPNILAHVRFNERTDADGKRVLFIEEIQSDWHQQGRKRGYGKKAFVVRPTGEGQWHEVVQPDGSVEGPFGSRASAEAWADGERASSRHNGVPDAPFKGTDEWAMLAFKRMVRWAADNGFDRVAWTTGEQQAERYDLSKHIDEIAYNESVDGGTLIGNKEGRGTVLDKTNLKPEAIADYIGKEVAEKLMALEPDKNGLRMLSGVDLKVGGAGMRAFYDKILPSAVNKWAKRFGAKVGTVTVDTQGWGLMAQRVYVGPRRTASFIRGRLVDQDIPAVVQAQMREAADAMEAGQSFENAVVGLSQRAAEELGGNMEARKTVDSVVHSLDLTPAMREAALQGQPLFSRPDTLAGQLNDALNSAKSLRLPSGKLLADFMDREGGLSWWHKSLGTQFNLAERYPSYKRVFDSVQGFLDDVSYYATEAMNEAPRILPQLESWKDITKQPISAQDSQAIAKPIFEGTLGFVRKPDGTVIKAYDAEGAGVVWTDQELRDRYGLNDQQISLYREFRAATDKSLTNLVKAQMVNLGGEDTQAVRARAMDAATVDEAAGILSSYLAKSAKIFPKRAKLLNQTAQQIMGKAELAKSLMSKGYAPLSRFGRHVVYVTEGEEQVYFGLFDSASDAKAMARKMQADHPEAQVETGTMSQESYKLFQGITPETLELFGEMLDLDQKSDNPADKAFQTYLKLAKNNRSALKRLIHRKGVAGYSEDPARVLASFIVSNSRLGATNLHTGETVKAIQAIPRSQGELKDQALKLFSYTRDPQEEAHALRALNFAQFLGGSIASAMVNLTQSITMTFPYLSQYGGAVKAAGRMKDAMALALKPKTGDAELDKAIKHGEEEGLLAPQEIHQLMAQARGSATLRSGDGTKAGNAIAAGHNLLAKLSLAWGKPFSVAEAYNRRAAFIAAWNTAKDQGIHAPYKFAEKAVRETQGVYSKANRPNWARGAIGSTVFTFKQFSIAYVEMLHRMATQGGPEGKKAALLALGVLFLMAGASGMPGADDLDDAIDGVMQRLGYNFSSKQAKHEFFAGILGEGGAQFVERGLSGLPGVPFDVSGRLGLGNLIPGTGLLKKKDDHSRDLTEVVGPTGDLLTRAGQSANAAAAGRFGEAGLALTPVAVRNLVQGIDMASSGFYKDQRGRKVVDTTAAEAAFKAIGFQPNTVAKVQRAAGDVQQMIALNKMVEREIADEWAQGLFDKDQARVNAAREALVKWNRRNPTSRIRVDSQQLRRRLRDLRASKAQRLEKTAPAEIRREVSERLSTE